MKDEIKEKIKAYYVANDIDEILDYITNLQEENKRYKKIFEGKERFSKIMPDDMDFVVLSKANYDRQQEDIELNAIELESRIDKAIDKLYCYGEVFDRKILQEFQKEMINTLTGGDKE